MEPNTLHSFTSHQLYHMCNLEEVPIITIIKTNKAKKIYLGTKV